MFKLGEKRVTALSWGVEIMYGKLYEQLFLCKCFCFIDNSDEIAILMVDFVAIFSSGALITPTEPCPHFISFFASSFTLWKLQLKKWIWTNESIETIGGNSARVSRPMRYVYVLQLFFFPFDCFVFVIRSILALFPVHASKMMAFVMLLMHYTFILSERMLTFLS